MGIGVHSGTATIGNVGTEKRLEYTIIGDPVNVATRIEALTKELGRSLLVSATTRERCTHPFARTELPAQPVRGLAEPLVTYTI